MTIADRPQLPKADFAAPTLYVYTKEQVEEYGRQWEARLELAVQEERLRISQMDFRRIVGCTSGDDFAISEAIRLNDESPRCY